MLKIFNHIFWAFPLLFIFTSYIVDDEQGQEGLLITTLFQNVERAHYYPVGINDEFSKKAFATYLKQLDWGKRFLTLDDVAQLKKYQLLVDDEVLDGTTNLFSISCELINKRVNHTQEIYRALLAEPIDFTKDEKVETDGEKIDFAQNDNALIERLRKNIKLQVLTRLSDILKMQEEATAAKDTTVKIKTFKDSEKSAREKVLANFDSWYHSLGKLTREDRFIDYLNALLTVYDPHTNYFSPNEKENFDMGMSGRLEGIGAQLREQDGFIKVARIVPGSASWKQGELKEGDIILKVAQGASEPVDVVDMRMDHAVSLIRGRKGTEVRLTVKKVDLTTKVIRIIRDVVVIEETYAKSAILKPKKSGKKIGYIQLQKFYTDFKKEGGRNSAEDVKRELLSLETEGVAGVILDLRNNSGGSLQDAVEMAGLFIEKGPIVQVRSRNAPPYVLADTDPLIQFDGPLVVLVNIGSASASEILAAAMQDYRRGVIIGSPYTHGKGTVQRMLALDELVPPQKRGILPLGSVKLTSQKFYRINGHSTQLKGMVPDIVLPDNFMFIDIGEKELDFPLKWDEIEPARYEKWKLTLPLGSLNQKSKIRTDANKNFQLIYENASRFKEQRDKTEYPLNLEKYRSDEKLLNEKSKKFNDIFTVNAPAYEVSLLKYQKEGIKADSALKDRLDSFHSTIKSDIYLNEAFLVTLDMGE